MIKKDPPPDKQASGPVPWRIRMAAYFTIASDEPSFHVPIIIFYGSQYLGMSITMTIILFYGIGGLSNLFEIPAGAFADRYGRRLSYLLGVTFIIFGLGSWFFPAPIFVYAIGRFIFCIGTSLSTGTIDAMAYEEFHRHNRAHEYLRFKSRSRASYYAMRLITMPLGAFLYTQSPQWAFIATMIPVGLAGAVSLFIPDNNVMPVEHTTMSLMKDTLRRVVRDVPLRWLSLSAFTVGVVGEMFWRLFQPSYKQAGLDVGNIGWFYSLFSLAAIVAMLSLGRISKKNAVFAAIIAAFVFYSVAYIATSIMTTIGVIIAVQIMGSFLFGVIEVPVPAFIQPHFEKYQQATVLSIYSMMFWGGVSAGDMSVAALLAYVDLDMAYTILAIISVCATVLFVPRLIRASKMSTGQPHNEVKTLVGEPSLPDLIG